MKALMLSLVVALVSCAPNRTTTSSNLYTTAAKNCAATLRDGWVENAKSHTIPSGGAVRMLGYTYSKSGARHAGKLADANPDLFYDFISFGMGPGGQTVEASITSKTWLGNSEHWFEEVCRVAIEAKSSFVELTAFTDEQDRTHRVFGARAMTGISSKGGYYVSTNPPTDLQTVEPRL